MKLSVIIQLMEFLANHDKLEVFTSYTDGYSGQIYRLILWVTWLQIPIISISWQVYVQLEIEW